MLKRKRRKRSRRVTAGYLTELEKEDVKGGIQVAVPTGEEEADGLRLSISRPELEIQAVAYSYIFKPDIYTMVSSIRFVKV